MKNELNDSLKIDFIKNAANKISWTGTGSSASDWAILSTFARLQYNWNDTYMATANIRVDGSSKFSKDNKWATFPSVSGAYRLTGEEFMKNQLVFEFIKPTDTGKILRHFSVLASG